MVRMSAVFSLALTSLCAACVLAAGDQPPQIININGEDAEVVAASAPHSIFIDPTFHRHSVLFQPQKEGDYISFALNADEAIPYDLGTVIWYNNDEDIYKIAVNGRQVTQMDFSTARSGPSTTTPHINFHAGRNIVTYTYTHPGANAKHGGIRFHRFELTPSQLMGH